MRIRHLLPVALMLLMLTPLIACSTPPPTPSTPIDLSTTLVPNAELDIYLYVRQENPTRIPKDILNTPQDLVVNSLAVWGVPSGEDLAFGGALTLTSQQDAEQAFALVKAEKELWTARAGSTIYFVIGSGAAARNLQAIISRNDFKSYDDAKALAELARLPNEGKTRLAGIAVVKPGPALVTRLAQYAGVTDPQTVNTVLSLAQLEVMVGGLYAPVQIDVAELAKKSAQGTIQEEELGVLILAKSGLPGAIVSPAAKQILERSEFTAVSLGEITAYQSGLKTLYGDVPLLVRVQGNRIFLAMAPREAYVRTLLTSIK